MCIYREMNLIIEFARKFGAFIYFDRTQTALMRKTQHALTRTTISVVDHRSWDAPDALIFLKE